MKRALLLLLALCLGIGAGEYLTTNFSFRQWIGRLVRHDELAALVAGRGIYDRDLAHPGQSLQSLIDRKKLDAAAARQPVRSAAIAHELDLLRWQFGAAQPWSTIRGFILHREAAENLRARAWLESQLPAGILPNEEEIRRFYEAHPAFFREPLRFRANHLFLAAPDGSPNDIVESKRTLINALAARLRKGESFPALVAQFSEDEATKAQGGDLNCFAEARMLPAIWSAAQSLEEGETSALIRSRLGFHLLRLTRRLPARQLSFAEAAAEITSTLENQNRAAAIAQHVARLGGKIEIAAPGD